MKLKAKEQSFLFSNTTIPDVFFAEYLSSASGDFVKVYLYLLYLSKYNKDIKINDLSRKLNLSFNLTMPFASSENNKIPLRETATIIIILGKLRVGHSIC